MLFTDYEINNKDFNDIKKFFDEFEYQDTYVNEKEVSNVGKYVKSLVTECYKKSVQDIQNTKIGNKIVRKRNLQQVMKESFFYGANRFGNNFIA